MIRCPCRLEGLHGTPIARGISNQFHPIGGVMTLEQFHSLKVWHQLHVRRSPVEKHVWDIVLTFWLMGIVGGPAAFLIHRGWAIAACFVLLFLPGAYVGLRRRLHRSSLLRCDWMAAIERRRR